ncbi:MAG TPA: DUF2800 domain-containing protein [Dyadobacter sp.]|nr:DUF2800 domain-containing protein [Dyadobacter sp.]
MTVQAQLIPAGYVVPLEPPVDLEHAFLGPSAGSIWTNCTPAMWAAKGYKDEGSDAAREGSCAHDLSEIMIKEKLGMITKQKYQFELIRIQQSQYYNAEMHEFCKGYMEFVLSYWSKALAMHASPVILIEEKFKLTRWIPQGFGKTDVTIVAGEWLFVLDFKYGQGVKVEAKGNVQTRLYALGALDAMRHKYPLKYVEMAIYQPRMKNIGRDQITAYELWEYAENFIRPQAEKAWLGMGEYKAGSHCKFCKAKPRCRTFAQYALTPAGRAEFEDPNNLSDEELSQIALMVPMLQSYSKDLTEYMLGKAVRENKQWPHMKLVEGRSVRVITNEAEAVRRLQEAGYRDVVNTKIKGLGDLEAIVGDMELEKLLAGILIKPAGKPTLVSDTDDRARFAPMQALDFFKDTILQVQR